MTCNLIYDEWAQFIAVTPPTHPCCTPTVVWMKAVAGVACCLFSMYIISRSVWTGCLPEPWFLVTLSASWSEHCFHAAGESALPIFEPQRAPPAFQSQADAVGGGPGVEKLVSRQI